MKKTNCSFEARTKRQPDMQGEQGHNVENQIDVDWQMPAEVVIDDKNLAHWLLDTSSLTERLQSMCSNFEVIVVSHQIQAPRADEIALLGCSKITTYIREVLLLGDGVPWVFARSVIPLVINDSELDGLGSEPLGKRIFNDTRFKRGAFQLCKLEWPSIKERLSNKTEVNFSSVDHEVIRRVYGRRSCFDFLGNKMSVAELFLPNSPAYSHVG